jgi:hypothetical protein
MNVRLQHKIMEFVNRTTVRHFVALPSQFGICDHHDVIAGGRRFACHVVRSGSCTADIGDTCIQTAAKSHLSVELLRHRHYGSGRSASRSGRFTPWKDPK